MLLIIWYALADDTAYTDQMSAIDPLLASVLEEVRVKHYPKNQIMLYQGDPLLDVFVLTSGVIKMYDIDEQGNEKILHLLRPGAVAPFSLFSGGSQPMKWFYTAMTDCDVYVLPYETFSSRLRAKPELMQHLMNWFSMEVHELLVRLSSMNKTNTHAKVRAALRYLAMMHAKQRRSGWYRVAFPVNHQLIADLTGITRESTAMIMKDLSREKAIRNPRQTILEIDLAKLS